MSAVIAPVAGCSCGSIGAPQEIRQCPEHFHLWFGDRRMASVGSVIKRLLPTDYSMVDPAVLESAAVRGKRVDSYFCEYLRTGNITVPANERQDVLDRLNLLIPWWDRQGLEVLRPETQKTVFSEADGVAGTLDIALYGADGWSKVMDLKCVSALQPAYSLQLGSYLTYGGFDEAAILHVTKDRVRLVKYEAEKCRRQWRAIVEAWKVCQELEP